MLRDPCAFEHEDAEALKDKGERSLRRCKQLVPGTGLEPASR
jgi:hypothetical protein